MTGGRGAPGASSAASRCHERLRCRRLAWPAHSRSYSSPGGGRRPGCRSARRALRADAAHMRSSSGNAGSALCSTAAWIVPRAVPPSVTARSATTSTYSRVWSANWSNNSCSCEKSAADDVPVRLLVGGRQVGQGRQGLVQTEDEARTTLLVEARDRAVHHRDRGRHDVCSLFHIATRVRAPWPPRPRPASPAR